MSQVRPATIGDYPAITELHNRVWPEHWRKPGDFARTDALWPTRRFVVQIDQIIGHAWVRERPEYLEVEVAVDTPYRGQGFGRLLYRAIEPILLDRGKPIISFVKEDHPYALAFAHKRGWSEIQRSYHQWLPLEHFELAQFKGLLERLQGEGFRFSSYDRLSEPGKESRFYQLFVQTEADVPTSTPYQVPTLEQFRENTLQTALAQATFVALYEGQYVGLTVTRPRDEQSLHTRMTGVLPQYRGKGLAVALKLQVVEYAKAQGFLELHTNNAAHNTAMLEVNARLGYLRHPAQIKLQKEPS